MLCQHFEYRKWRLGGNSDSVKKYRPTVKHKPFGLDLKSSPGGLIIRQFMRRRNMSESLQRRRTTSNANTWVANSYYILYDKENRCVLSRFFNVDGVGAVRMSRGKLFHAVGPATENAWLSSWRLVRGPRSVERGHHARRDHGLQSGERVATVVTGTHTCSSFIYDDAGPFIAL